MVPTGRKKWFRVIHDMRLAQALALVFGGIYLVRAIAALATGTPAAAVDDLLRAGPWALVFLLAGTIRGQDDLLDRFLTLYRQLLRNTPELTFTPSTEPNGKNDKTRTNPE